MPVARKRLQHGDAISFGVLERDVLPDARNLHRFAEHFAAGRAHLLHRLGDIFDGDDHRGILRGPIRPPLIEASVDGGVSLAEVISGEVLSLNDEVDLNGEKGMVKWGEMTDFSADVLYGKIEISIKYFYFIQ